MVSLVSPKHKPLAWLLGTVTTPPLGPAARVAAGYLLRQLQARVSLSMPESRPVPTVGAHCHELRVNDAERGKQWRIIYRIDTDAIVVAHWFQKTTPRTPQGAITTSRQRLALYDEAARGSERGGS